MSPRGIIATVAAGVFALPLLVIVLVLGTATGGAAAGQPGAAGTVASDMLTVGHKGPVAAAISYARMQLGKPYLWGGTGPDAFDCSGLMMMAYRAAGINIPRTSQEQWSWGPHIPASQVQPGDLVFFAGSDGTPTSPGHVGLVIGKNTMIEAYATGFPIRISQFGTPGSAAGDGTVVGFTRPASRSSP